MIRVAEGKRGSKAIKEAHTGQFIKKTIQKHMYMFINLIRQ